MKIYDITVTKSNGEQYALEKYKGQVMLIVNTASKCGFTPQFSELEALYQKYKEQGFVVLGFPSNQFKQELATAIQAEVACRANFGVTFPMHEMVKVNGTDAHPLFSYLVEETKGIMGSKIKWNFTKFLVDREGNVVKRYSPAVKPFKFEEDIKNLL